jgi:hypothetical protein
MNRVTGRLAVSFLTSLVLFAVLSACFQRQSNPRPQDDEPVVIKPPGTPNEYLLAVGELEPNFGGFFVDQEKLNIYLLNADTATRVDKDSVVRSLVRVYGEDILELSRLPATFLKGDYGMVDLYNWYAKLNELFSIDEIAQTVEVSFTDLDEGRNRIALGVLDASMIPAVQRGLTELEIPVAAVIIEEEGYACALPGWSSIVAEVRDAEGQPTAIGATVTITKEGYEASSVGFGDPLQVYVGDSEGGTVVEDVEVVTDECGYGDTVAVEATLTLQPDAPPVRQVVVSPGDIGLGGGYSVQETAYVEEDLGVSKEVVWRSGDESVATVSADGVVTGVCRDTHGETLITATSVADPSKSDSLSVGVSAAYPEEGMCP